MKNKLVTTLCLALVAGVFLGLAFGSVRNRMDTVTADNMILSEMLENLQYQMDTLNATHRDYVEVSSWEINLLSQQNGDLQQSVHYLRNRYDSLKLRYDDLKAKYEALVPPAPSNMTVQDFWTGGWAVDNNWSVGATAYREPVLPIPPIK